MLKKIKRRVQTLSGVLGSPVRENDYAEKGRRVVLRRFVLVRRHTILLISLRGLEGIVTKLEPLTDQNGLVAFLRNTDNAKTLTGFIEELADVVKDYEV